MEIFSYNLQLIHIGIFKLLLKLVPNSINFFILYFEQLLFILSIKFFLFSLDFVNKSFLSICKDSLFSSKLNILLVLYF